MFLTEIGHRMTYSFAGFWGGTKLENSGSYPSF